MASVHFDQDRDFSFNPRIEKLLPLDYDEFAKTEIVSQTPSDSFESSDKVGTPEVVVRVGHEYQAEIPPVIGELDYSSLMETCMGSENKSHPLRSFLIGLPIPLTLICNMKQEVLGSNDRLKFISDFRDSQTSVLKKELDSENLMEDSKKILTSDNCNVKSYAFVPGLPDKDWSKAERDGFLLGLYIFEKNFVEVRRFVETKEMGSILSFYYGIFYGSQEYRRWSESRKTKHKKCVYGQKIFSGLRRQELLSRIVPLVSEECQNAVMEVSKTFEDEQMSLSDYVFSLKAMVGMDILVQAVGIGTGKQDLTGMAFESPKPGHVVPTRPEIPSGRACSSLTTVEIIKFLSGDYRLSKARSNDLFWEAVWPRLLARGWHSEQPKDQSYTASSSHCLVFLLPGVNKFSRRKLVKGDHYFDSVSDVLSKVAKEPRLIELDDGENDGGKSKEESVKTSEVKFEQENDDDKHMRKQHCYLQPKTPRRNSAVMKFTIVDMSLSGGKVREVRCLPSEITRRFTAQGCSDYRDDDDDDKEEKNTKHSETINTRTPNTSVTDNGNHNTSTSDEKLFSGSKRHDANESYQDGDFFNPDIRLPIVSELKDKKTLRKVKQMRKASNPISSRKLKKRNSDSTNSVARRCKTLSGGSSKEETGNGMLTYQTTPTIRLENGMSDSCASIHEITRNSSSQAALSQDVSSSATTSQVCPTDHSENPQTQTSFDLNVPQVVADSEKAMSTTEPSKEPVIESITQEYPFPKPSDIKVTTTSEQMSDSNPRRHSTRTRPPTARALEALADGYLTVSKKRKVKGTTSSSEGAKLRSSHRARVVVGADRSTDSSVASHVMETEKSLSNTDNSNTLS